VGEVAGQAIAGAPHERRKAQGQRKLGGWKQVVMGAFTSPRPASRLSPARPGAWDAARALLAALSIAVLAAGSALAQTARPTVSVAATISAKPAAQAPLAIRVGPADALPRDCFIRIRGLPPTVALSEGHSIAPGSWAIPIAALSNLRIILPAGLTGTSDIFINLVNSDGTVLSEAKSILTVAAPLPSPDNHAQYRGDVPPASILRAGTPVQAPHENSGRAPASIPQEGQTKLSPEQRERALRLVKRGDEQLAEGGVAQARLLYERAAEAGLAQGAMALAATYDSAELSRLGVRGLQPDRASALRWYERARQLGAGEAELRLRRLGAN
jgi:hypothetical protein